MSDDRPTNRLATATSPYLLQHAHNPVDWYPWGEEALERARREDKPILLSIGYAACHWCHVMERESFEDPPTAELMNAHFVSIKVDREERPDVDAIYMDAAQAMTGHGGWPLTAFLTPDGKPFYAGTYFPNEDRHGLPAFRKILAAIADAWTTRREEAETQAQHVVDAIGRASALRSSGGPLDEELRSRAFSALRARFDPIWGGFGTAPKFPQPMTLEFVLRAHLRGTADALETLATTLDRMAFGGMHDQVGGGFHRYSTDERWHVPHFEKMLSDNAQLARLYVRAWQVTGEERYRTVASRTCDYLLREMRHPAGGFFSSQDTDTEGVEGRTFVWSWDELLREVGEPVAAAFGATPSGNWEGTNVLWMPHALAGVADEYGLRTSELERAVEAARASLFQTRERRPRPTTDDKVIAGWNGLAVAALAEAGRALGEVRYVEAATGAARFVLSELRGASGRLLRSWRDGTAGGLGCADDHALMADACLALYETTFELRWFEEARRLVDDLLRLFQDEEHGGFFQTGADAQALVVRSKDLSDNATPSGNSAAADVLLRVAHLTGEPAYERAGLSALGLVRDLMGQAPGGFGHALSALDLAIGPVREVAIVGSPQDPATRALVDEVLVRRFVPNHVLAVAGPHDEALGSVTLLEGRTPVDGRPAAYVCERFTCRLPLTDPAALAGSLES